MIRMIKKFLSCTFVTLLMVTLLLGCNSTDSNDGTANLDSDSATDESEVNSDSIATETESSQEDSYDGMTTLTYIGHASIKLKSSDGTVIYIDPSFSGDYSEPADFILVTHAHSDHQASSNQVEKKEDCIKITQKEALVDGEYSTFDYENIKIEAVAAGGNPNHDIKNGVGYIVTIDGITVYHAGDTSMIDEMNLLTDKNIDYAMYPIDGTYNMDAVEAAEVADLVGATHNIPIHEYDQGKVNKSDNFNPNGRLIVAYEETIVLSK